MALVIPRAVTEQLPPDLAELIRLMTVLAAYDDRDFLQHHVELFRHRVQWVKEKADAADARRGKQRGA